jgi:Tfp pilus assembly protein PilX
MNNQTRSNASERGVALIIVLLTILVLGILAATVTFTSQAQTWTAMNYRLSAQARYAAEAGVQNTMNWLSNNYTAPTTFTSYTTTSNPVTCAAGCTAGHAVVLSAISGVSSYYPDSTVSTAFNTALSGKSVPGITNATYSTSATLLRMNTTPGVSWLGTGSSVLQTWQITSVGSITGLRNATVQVVATYERAGTPLFTYPIEATGTGCGSINFNGTTVTDSYNSSNGVYGAGNSSTSGGNVATNGNLQLATGSAVNGTVYVPNTTVGACPDGITKSGTGTYTTAAVIGTLTPPLPWGCATTPCNPPGTLSTAAQNVSTGCLTIAGCTKNGTTTITDGGSSKTVNVFTLTPTSTTSADSYGNITINSADVVHVSAGTYNINSINFAQDGQFVIDSGPVVFNIVGNCASGCPNESGLPSGYSSTEVIYGAGFAGMNGCAPSGGTGVTANPNVYGSVTCGAAKTAYSGIPSNLQVVYSGTYTVRLGGMPNAAVIYAPNASYYTPGAPVGLYGSAVVKNFEDDSSSPFHYDRALQNSALQAGPFRPVGFSWSKF